MRRLLLSALSILALLAQAAPAVAQDADPLRFTDNVSVGYVMIPFTVLGPRGNPLTDLRSRDVQLLVDGQKVKSDMFERSMNAPVSFTILLDGSGSMGLAGKMDAARAAIGTLIAHRKPGDDFALYVFSDQEAEEVVPFTEDPAAITRGLGTVKPFGKTAFFDALATMPERSQLGRNPTRAVILLSDGIDNNSHLKLRDVARLLEGVAVPIYPIGLRESAEQVKIDPKQPNEELSDLRLLEEIANLTGGRLFVGTKPQQISAAADALDKNLRAQYLIGFTPTGKGDVKYRRISLKVGPNVRSIRVRAGYRGTEPPVVASKIERKRSS